MSLRRRREDSDSDEEQQPSSRRRLDLHPFGSGSRHVVHGWSPRTTTSGLGRSAFLRGIPEITMAHRNRFENMLQTALRDYGYTPTTTTSAAGSSAFLPYMHHTTSGSRHVVRGWAPSRTGHLTHLLPPTTTTSGAASSAFLPGMHRATSASTSAVSNNMWRPIEPTATQLTSSFAATATTASVPRASFTTSFPIGSPWRDTRLPLVEDPEPGSELSEFKDRHERSIALLPPVPNFYQLGRTQPSTKPWIQRRTRTLRVDQRKLDIPGVDPKFLLRTYPRTTFISPAYENVKGTDAICEICLSELFEEDATIDEPWKITETRKNDWIAITQCRKAYHRNCLYRWLQSGVGELKTCTNCRGKDIIFLISESLGYDYSYLRKIRG